MDVRDSLKLEANVLIRLIGPDGVEKERREAHNTVTNDGKYGAADQALASPTLPKPGWMELGTGTASANQKLGAAISGSRVALTSKTRTNGVVTMVGDWAAGVGTGAVSEAGIFSVVTADTAPAWNYVTFAAVNKLAADALQISWTLTFA